MIAGEVYRQDEELLQLRLVTRDLLYEFNHIHPRKLSERQQLIKKCSSKLGTNSLLNNPFIATMESTSPLEKTF
nr:maltose acetyltransferase domain-containing protein [Enterococcus mundtii]